MPSQSSVAARLSVVLFIVVASIAVSSAEAQPVFSKTFAPNTVGPNGTSRLTFVIDNSAGPVVTSLAFTDALPAGMTLADGANPVSTCGGTLTAPNGGGTITLVDGAIGAGQICTISVFVTASTLGTLTNTTGDLTSSAGNSGTATDDLDVVNTRPAFSKSFSPNAIPRGSRSTLTFTIDNSASGGIATSIGFTDPLPVGIEIADPANLSHDCTGATVTSLPGSQIVSLVGGFLLAGQSCTVTLDVVATGAGLLTNVSSELFSSPGGPQVSSGFATATLDVSAPELSLIKRFVDDPAIPGGTTTLEFTVENRSRTDAAANIAFTDDLDATLSGLVAASLPASNVCGAGSTLSGTSTITLTGGNLPAQGTCTFQVVLQVPAGATAGAYPNTTSTITADVGGGPTTGPAADDILFVAFFPTVTKTFLTNPVGSGGVTDMEFTITNTSATSSAADITFTDNLSAFYSGVTPTSLPAPGFCGGGSGAVVFDVLGDSTLLVNGASLPAGGSCTFTVGLQIPAGGPGGDYPNVTSAVAGTVGGTPVIGFPTSDTLTVLSAPRVTKSFTDDPVAPGGTVTLEFTITHEVAAPADATAISFSDDLTSVITGLAATGLPLNDVCGAGSQISGTTNLTFTGGTLAPGASCTFSVPVTVPPTAVPGVFPNTTSNVIATVSGAPVAAGPAGDSLIVSGLSMTKEFIDDPALPGGQTTLRFTIDNTAGADATGMFFTDSLSSALSGLAAAAPLPSDPCGAGSTIAGTTTLIVTGGNLLAGTSCTFDVTLDIPGGAADGQYLNTTSSLSATIGGEAATLPPAADVLEISTDLLALSKEFTNDPVTPGGTVTLEFTVSNLDDANAIDTITFTDDLGAFYPGLSATNLPLVDPCGTGSQVPNGSPLTLLNGTIPAGGSCTFSVTLQVPPGDPGTPPFVNTTSAITGEIGGIPVSGGAATDELRVLNADFSKTFDGPTTAGGTAILSFTISNLSATTQLSGLGFTDDLSAVIPGLVATGLPLSDVCGTGSTVSGTSFLAFTGGSVLPSGSCTIDVPVQIPAGAAPGTYPNTSSQLNSGGIPTAPPATADLAIEPPPTFAKVFAPDTIGAAQISTLTFTVDNSASAVAATNLDFTDNLPAGTVVATPSNASTTCTGGTLTAADGSAVITYTGGTAPAGGSCTVTVDIAVTGPGASVNTSGDLTSNSGNSGPASDTLTVATPPTFAKAFAPATAAVDEIVALTFTIDNSASPVDAVALDFSDTFPAGLAVASPANATSTCAGGSITAAPGATSVAFSGGTVTAGSSCSVSVDVVASTTGGLVNLSGALTSTSGSSGTATDTLQIEPAPGFTKAFNSSPILVGGTTTLVFTIDNTTSSLDATSLDFADPLPAGMTVAPAPNASTTCTGGTLTAAAGSGTVSYSGGTAPAGAACTVQADVTVASTGTFDNTSSALTSSLGASPAASDSLVAVDTPIGLAATFLSSPVVPGGPATLEYTVSNLSPDFTATALTFSDDLDAALAGLVATGLPQSDICGAGSLVAGTSVVTLTGGTLPPSASCTFQVDVLIPPTAGDQTVTTTSSDVSGDLDGLPVTGAGATAGLDIATVAFDKLFLDDATAGGSVGLRFTLTNPDPSNPLTDIAFTDDLDAVLPGLVALGLPTADACGLGSSLDGTSTISLTGASLAAGGSCTFDVTVGVPGGTPAGLYSNVTDALGYSVAGVQVAGEVAQDDLQVQVQQPAIPTLSELGLWILIGLIALVGALTLRRTI
jgi:hypothetical protein